MAEIKYKMAWIPDPWDEEARRQGQKCWCLCKLVEPELNAGPLFTSFEPVAMFNRDSAAELFQAHLFKGGSVEIEETQRRLCVSVEKADAFHKAKTGMNRE